MNPQANAVIAKINKIERNLRGLGQLRQDVDELQNFLKSNTEVSKRGQAIIEDVFHIIFTATFTAVDQTTTSNFVVASDYDFAALKYVAGPIPTINPINNWEFQVRDGSSDIMLSNALIPANAMAGVGALPFIEIAPRRFAARGSILIDFHDLSTAAVYPYTAFLVIHGKKMYRVAAEMRGQ